MIIPMYHGRPMKLLKEYPNFVLFQDVKTGVKVSFNYYELQMKESKKISDEELKQHRRKPYDKVVISNKKKKKVTKVTL